MSPNTRTPPPAQANSITIPTAPPSWRTVVGLLAATVAAAFGAGAGVASTGEPAVVPAARVDSLVEASLVRARIPARLDGLEAHARFQSCVSEAQMDSVSPRACASLRPR
jgi:hypothetical protein